MGPGSVAELGPFAWSEADQGLCAEHGVAAVLSLVGHIAAYRDGEGWLNELCGYVRGNLRMVAGRLSAVGLDWQPPQAGYLAWIDLRPLGIHEDEPLRRELIEREKVAIMPGGAYGAPGFVRLNVGCPRAKAGADALVRAVRRLTA
ncbi:cystathione beta-lyase [Streptomyces indicus]|uniref:cysteine-S-conjugate beta-lyase n=1 Tax=Streptomyces indicus TaxID=417292 RepID=A0A1G9CFS9_9ACTN|nr:cystathione beta-lyase [Streptomyces indicus]